MNRLLNISIMGISICFFTARSNSSQSNPNQPDLGTSTVKLIEQDGLKFKDLNKNGQLDPYEDWRLSPHERSKDS